MGRSGQMGTEEFGTDYADLWNHDSLPPYMMPHQATRDPAGPMYNYLKQSKKKQKKMKVGFSAALVQKATEKHSSAYYLI